MKTLFLGLFVSLGYSIAWGQVFYNKSIPSLPMATNHNVMGRIDSQPFFIFPIRQISPQENLDSANQGNASIDSLSTKTLITSPDENSPLNLALPIISFESSIQGLQFVKPSPLNQVAEVHVSGRQQSASQVLQFQKSDIVVAKEGERNNLSAYLKASFPVIGRKTVEGLGQQVETGISITPVTDK